MTNLTECRLPQFIMRDCLVDIRGAGYRCLYDFNAVVIDRLDEGGLVFFGQDGVRMEGLHLLSRDGLERIMAKEVASLRAQLAKARAETWEAAAVEAGMNALRYAGIDAYSAGMDAGARLQVDAIVEALRAKAKEARE